MRERIEKLLKDVAKLEDEEDYDGSFEKMKQIAKLLGYKAKLTEDGNWTFWNSDNKIEVLYDSGRGSYVPVWTTKNGKESHELHEAGFANTCVAFMKRNRES